MQVLGHDCGCNSRKEIMSSGPWKTDVIAIAVVVLIACCIAGGKRLK